MSNEELENALQLAHAKMKADLAQLACKQRANPRRLTEGCDSVCRMVEAAHAARYYQIKADYSQKVHDLHAAAQKSS